MRNLLLKREFGSPQVTDEKGDLSLFWPLFGEYVIQMCK